MTAPQKVLDFYAEPSAMTAAGKHKCLLDVLPDDVGELVSIVQGIGLYDVVVADFYGFPVLDERSWEIHIRPVEAMLDRLLGMDDRPLAVVRPLKNRLLGRCHHFMLLLVAMLRAKRTPARARCGFGAYFNAPYYEDHWVCEYWNADESRWCLADPQFDAVWREKLKIRHDILDVPRDQFLVAAEAWERCRKGEADPSKFGIDFAKLRGLWFVAGSLVRDVAALNKVELLPWDVWGAQPRPGQRLDEGQLAFFDRLAALTRDPDARFAELRSLYDSDERLRVPDTVLNALTNRREAA